MPGSKGFAYPHVPEERYAIKLRKIAEQVGQIISSFPPGDPAYLPAMQRALAAYAEAIKPWARKAAMDMLKDVSNHNNRIWRNQVLTPTQIREQKSGRNSRLARHYNKSRRMDRVVEADGRVDGRTRMEQSNRRGITSISR